MGRVGLGSGRGNAASLSCPPASPAPPALSRSLARFPATFHHPAVPEAATPALERTLPHNLDAERSILGAVLIDNEAFNVAAAVIDGRSFFRDAHRRIFERMVELSERSQPIDLVTLKDALERIGDLDEVGGPAYIASLVDGVPRATNVEVLRPHRQGEGHPSPPDLLGEQDPVERVRGRSGCRPHPRRSGERDLRGRRRPDQDAASSRCAIWSRPASRRSSSSFSTRASSPASPPASPRSTR